MNDRMRDNIQCHRLQVSATSVPSSGQSMLSKAEPWWDLSKSNKKASDLIPCEWSFTIKIAGQAHIAEVLHTA